MQYICTIAAITLSAKEEFNCFRRFVWLGRVGVGEGGGQAPTHHSGQWLITQMLTLPPQNQTNLSFPFKIS